MILFIVLDTLNEKELLNPEIRKILRVVVEELKFREKDAETYLQRIRTDPKLQSKHYAYQSLFDEFFGKQ